MSSMFPCRSSPHMELPHMSCDIQERSISNGSNQLGCRPSDRAQNPTLGELNLSQGGQQLSQ